MKVWKMIRLGIDVGDKRIGLALGGSNSFMVTEVRFINRGQKELEELKEIVQKKKVGEIVVGYPIGLSGKPTFQTKKVLAFYRQLKETFKDIPIVLWDERFTTQLAIDSLKARQKRKISQKKGRVDALSAAFILQSYLDYQRTKNVLTK